MARSTADLLALKNEMINDPKGLGFVAPPAIDDVGNAEKFNLVRETLRIDRTAVRADEFDSWLDRDEQAGLSSSDLALLARWTADGSIDLTGEVLEGLNQMFPVGTESRTNLEAGRTAATNRVEQMLQTGLLDIGGTVTPSDISQARQV